MYYHRLFGVVHCISAIFGSLAYYGGNDRLCGVLLLGSGALAYYGFVNAIRVFLFKPYTHGRFLLARCPTASSMLILRAWARILWGLEETMPTR